MLFRGEAGKSIVTAKNSKIQNSKMRQDYYYYTNIHYGSGLSAWLTFCWTLVRAMSSCKLNWELKVKDKKNKSSQCGDERGWTIVSLDLRDFYRQRKYHRPWTMEAAR